MEEQVILKQHSDCVVEVLYKGFDHEQWLIDNKSSLKEDVKNGLISVRSVKSLAESAEKLQLH